MVTAFGITSTAVDRAFLGYSSSVDDSQHNANWSNDVLMYLRDGDTLDQAVKDATTFVGAPTNGATSATTVIYGDKTMKLHSVYGGTAGAWYR
ncbi:MAG: hypothetical protein C4321_04535 [Chloroflexota bacterium]